MYYIGYLFGTVAISIFSVVIQLVYHWNASIYSPQIKESYDYIIGIQHLVHLRKRSIDY